VHGVAYGAGLPPAFASVSNGFLSQALDDLCVESTCMPFVLYYARARMRTDLLRTRMRNYTRAITGAHACTHARAEIHRRAEPRVLWDADWIYRKCILGSMPDVVKMFTVCKNFFRQGVKSRPVNVKDQLAGSFSSETARKFN
jgi:hypothetical protein